MNIKEAKQELKRTVRAYMEKDGQGQYEIPMLRQRPVLLMGPPGVGKTQIMEQVARECGTLLVAYTITHHTRQSAVGLPYIEKEEYDGKIYSVTQYTMSEIIASIYQKMEDTGLREGILFIDEINCVSETLAPTMLQFLQCKTFGNQRIPEGWVIVAAGNPPEYNKSVREFDVVTLDRVRRMDIGADYEVWKEYARDAGIDRALLAYLDLHPKNFYRMEMDVDGMQFVTARGWEDFSHMLQAYRRQKVSLTPEMVYEYLRLMDVAEDVAAYLELYEKYQDDYGIGDILQGQVSTEIYRRLYDAAFDERLAVVNLLLDKLFHGMEQVRWQKRRTDVWYDFLKEYRKEVERAENARACYEELLRGKVRDWDGRKDAGLWSGREVSFYLELGQMLESSGPRGGRDAKESFQEAKQGFDQCRRQMEGQREEWARKLECTFDFMEEAFGEGEEMIVFVTELTMSQEGVSFLADYHCERYLQYSERLLVGSRKRALLSELEEKL